MIFMDIYNKAHPTLLIVTVIVLVQCLFLHQACAGKIVIDQVGREVDVPADPVRVLALAPNVAEIIFLLGQEKRLKGATQYSNHPEEAEKLPRIGSYVRLDVEKIVALKPDLCIGTRDGNPINTVERIDSLGIPVYVVDPQSLSSIMDTVTRLGVLLGASERASRIVSDMNKRIEHIEKMVALASDRPTVFFQIDAAPIISAGSNTFIHELITRAGGRNLAAGNNPYPRYNWEDILRLQPEIAIIASMAGGHPASELRSGWLKWPQLAAVRNNRVHVVDADLIDRPTPRLLDGLEEFAAIIHPEIFGENGAE
jgi:iron complex transport system substrate-binding protein